MRRIAVFAMLALGSSTSLGERILDQMYIVDRYRYTFAPPPPNHSGGILVWGDNYSTELADDFRTTSTGYVLTEIEVGNITYGLEPPATAWVSVYEVARGSGFGARPKETALYDSRHEVTTNTPFEDRRYFGLKTTISGLSIPLTPDTQYFISVQTESGDWAHTAANHDSHDAPIVARDNGRNGYKGGYGWTTWTWFDYSFSSAAYRIEAVPEACSAALLLGAAALLRRRGAKHTHCEGVKHVSGEANSQVGRVIDPTIACILPPGRPRSVRPPRRTSRCS